MRFRYIATALFLLSTGIVCQAQTISTVTGSSMDGFSGDGGPASAAQINGPQGMSFDSKGDLYFADSDNQRIRMIAAPAAGATLSTGTITTVAGSGVLNTLGTGGITGAVTTGPALSIPLSYPTAVLALPAGGFYLSDFGAYFVNTSGSLIPDNLNGVQGFASDPQGNIYGFSFNGTSIFKYTPGATSQVTVAGSPTTPGDGGDGGAATSALFTTIAGIASDSTGNIYVADSGSCRVRRFKVGGTISTVAGNGICASSQPAIGSIATTVSLTNPNSPLVVDSNGNIYIGEGNGIDQVSSKGIFNHFAGVATGSTYTGDGGPALDAFIGAPQYLAVDSTNNIYVSTGDPVNRILMISAACVTNCPVVATPVIAGVSSAATNKQTITPGDWVSIYGSGLASTTGGILPTDIIGNSLPTVLNGVSVTVDGIPAAVSYTSAGQVNIEIPSDTTIGSVPVVLTNNGFPSAAFPISMAATSASLFGYYSGSTFFAVAQHLDYSLITTTAPAAVGETIILYADGLGATTPAVTPGMLYSGAAPLVDTATVTVGGVAGTVSFAGLIGAGLYQLNIVVPQVAAGSQSLTVTLTSGGTTVDMTQSGALLPVQ